MAIYSYLQGGLGNQLFQYAIARALSERYQVDFALDRSWFAISQDGVTPRQFQLELLNIPGISYSNSPFPKKPSRLKRFLQNTVSNGPIIHYQKNTFDFDPTLFSLRNLKNRDLYLSGYWQGFPYIETIRPILQKDFELRASTSPHYQPYLQQIAQSESVMLHIRRGDYIDSPSAAQFHGVLPLNYYLKAISAIQSTKEDAHFYVFSDDLPWAKVALPKNLKITFVENSMQADAAVQELQLMRACKHHIIANSSLSWWGAWLKNNIDGLIFAPNRWIRDDKQDLTNLLPPQWQQLST
jgi:hypothetical protein